MTISNSLFNEIGIKNFKSWKDETFIPIEHLNLIFGNNSSGKSSFIQSMILLSQSCQDYDPILSPTKSPVQKLKLLNKYRDHGSFADILHGGKFNK